MDLNDLKSWQAVSPSRSVSIKINCKPYPNEAESTITIWVYDYNLMTGQYVSEIAEIDLEAVKEEEERKTLEKLQAKYGGRG